MIRSQVEYEMDKEKVLGAYQLYFPPYNVWVRYMYSKNRFKNVENVLRGRMSPEMQRRAPPGFSTGSTPLLPIQNLRVRPQQRIVPYTYRHVLNIRKQMENFEKSKKSTAQNNARQR